MPTKEFPSLTGKVEPASCRLWKASEDAGIALPAGRRHSECGDEASTSRPLDLPTSQPPGDYAKAEKAVLSLSKLVIDYHDWIRIGQSLYAGFGEEAKPLWDMFLDNPNYTDDQRLINLKWNSFKNVRTITLATLFYMADKYGVSYE